MDSFPTVCGPIVYFPHQFGKDNHRNRTSDISNQILFNLDSNDKKNVKIIFDWFEVFRNLFGFYFFSVLV